MSTKKIAKTPVQPAKRALADDQRTLTVKDVAELDRCSEKTVRRAIAAGLLEATRIGPGQRLLRVTLAAHKHYRRAQCG